MKRWIAGILIGLSLLSCCGCQQDTPAPEGPAFYYCAADISYGIDSTTIQAEHREAAAQDSLQEMLSKYFAGPVSEELRSPFPAGLQLVEADIDAATVYITVSDRLAALSGLELTLACSCIALTCLEFTGAEKVVINAQDALLDGQKSITMDQNTLLLLDTVLEGE